MRHDPSLPAGALRMRAGAVVPPPARPRGASAPGRAGVDAPAPRKTAPPPPGPDRRRRLANSRRLRRRPPKRRTTIIVAAVLTLLAILGVIGGAEMGLAFLESSVGRLGTSTAFAADSLVYDRGGTLIADLHPNGETRLPVPLSAISNELQQATVAIEDRAFWSEGAADPARIIAAAWQDLAHHQASQGASTITMQLAKVAYLSNDYEKSVSFKVRELLVARHLESSLSKQQILNDYLNDIPFGHGATGIQAAAHVYFGIDASRLDLAQSAMLAGLPNAPTDLDPLVHPDAAHDRQLQVLRAMVDTHVITQAQSDAAAAEPLHFASGWGDNVNVVPAFSNRVAEEVRSRLGLDAYRAGLHIVTTLDLNLQRLAEKTVAQQVRVVAGYHVTDGALVSVDPSTGAIVAYVGNAGPNVPGSQIDMASSPRQPGSTFKLFTYSTAFAQKKLTMLTPIHDGPYSLPTGGPPNGMGRYVVQNYDLRYHGTLPAAEALGNSLNVPAVKVEMLAGIPNVVRTARAMGVTTLDKPDDSYGASLTLGSWSVPLWEMAQAASIFADQGRLNPAYTLQSVKGPDGRERLPAPATPKQALDPGVAYIVNAILRDDRNRVMEFGAHSDLTLDGHSVSAKTGTTTDFKDNLTVGWTPHLATATWVGNTDDTQMRGTTGITGAAPMWHAFMTKALTGQGDDWAPPPDDVYQTSLFGRTGWFLKGTGPDPRGLGLNGTTSDVRYEGGCRFWSYNGGQYYWCGDGMSGLPGDPGPQGGGGPVQPTPFSFFGSGTGILPAPIQPGHGRHH